MDLTKITDVEVDGVDYDDYPDFCDAYISSAKLNGVEMTEEELEELSTEHPDFVYETVINYLF